MFAAIKGWYTALSLGSKITTVAISSFVGLGAIGSVTPEAPEPKPEPTPVVEGISTETEKEVLPNIKVKKETKTESVTFETTYINDANLEQGKSVVRTEGKNGIKTFIYEVTYTDGKETARKLIGESITTAPVTKVIAQGTKVPYTPPPAPVNNCDPNYTPCVPNVSYDLDCPDIGFMVRVIGSDPHRFDRDKDGYGCESYN